MMNKKQVKVVGVVIAVILILAMVLGMILPYMKNLG